MSAPRRFVIDTDLGSDLDDLLALILLGRLAPASIVGCCTVYGDTMRRALMADCTLAMLGLDDEVVVVAGAERPLSGASVWETGNEGDGWPALTDTARIHDARADCAALTRVCCEGPVDVIAIGPLTNLANALRSDDGFAERVRRIFMMGGFFGGPRIEHNFRCDAIAAAEVFESGIPIVVSSVDITLRSWYGATEVRQLGESADEFGRFVSDQMRRWLDVSGQAVGGDSPHDAICVLTALRPDLFEFEQGTISVTPDGDRAGLSQWSREGDVHERVVEMDIERVQAEIFENLRQ